MFKLINKILESTKYGFDLDGIDGMSDENADDIGTTDIINNAIVQGSDQFPGHDSDFWKGTVLFRRFTQNLFKLLYRSGAEMYSYGREIFVTWDLGYISPNVITNTDNPPESKRTWGYIDYKDKTLINLKYSEYPPDQDKYGNYRFITDNPKAAAYYMDGPFESQGIVAIYVHGGCDPAHDPKMENNNRFNDYHFLGYPNSFMEKNNLYSAWNIENITWLFKDLYGIVISFDYVQLDATLGYSEEHNEMHLYNFYTEQLKIFANVMFGKQSNFTIYFENNFKFIESEFLSLDNDDDAILTINMFADMRSTFECDNYTLTLDFSKCPDSLLPYNPKDYKKANYDGLKITMTDQKCKEYCDSNDYEEVIQPTENTRVFQINLTEMFPALFNTDRHTWTIW